METGSAYFKASSSPDAPFRSSKYENKKGKLVNEGRRLDAAPACRGASLPIARRTSTRMYLSQGLQ